MSTLNEIRNEAKRLGVPWREVVQAKLSLQRSYQEQREAIDGPRRLSWEMYCRRTGRLGWLCIWRRGWQLTYSWISNSGRDYTCIPRYDELVRDVASEFPEWQDREAEEFYEMLFSDYEPEPSTVELYEEALGMIEAQLAMVPF